MKTKSFFVLFLSVLPLFFGGCYKQLDVPSQSIKVVRIVELPGVSKKEILNRAKLWVAEQGASYKHIVDYNDPDLIIAKANIKYPCEGVECMAKKDWRIWFTLKVEAKDAKMRATVTDFEISWPPRVDSLGYHKGVRGPIRFQKDMDIAKAEAEKLIDRMEKYIKNKKKDDNW